MFCLKNKKIFLLFVLLLFILILPGCNKKIYDEKYAIDYKEIYNQPHDDYYVYFYKQNCSYCDGVFDLINKYLNSEAQTKLFVCDITNTEIARIYEGEKGQGSQGQHYINGIKKYEDLYIGGAPLLIKITNKESNYIASGRKDVKLYVNDILNNAHKHVHKYNDGVCKCGEKQVFTVYFKDSDGTILKEEKVIYGNNANPPQVKEKEDYEFIGWDNDIYNITTSQTFIAQYQYTKAYIIDEFGLPQLTEAGQEYIKTLYCEAMNTEKDHSSMYITKYIGNFNGAEVVKFERGGVDWVTYEIIEDLVFELRDGGDYYEVIYQNEVYRLPEAYKEKILTYEDIKEIYRLDALWEEYNRFDIFDAFGLRFVLTLHGEKQLKEAYYNQFLKDKGEYTIDDVIIKDYICWTGLGAEKSYRAAIFDYKGSDYTKGTYTERIAGYDFTYDDNNTIMVWHNSNQFYTLKNLYSKGLIEDKYVEIICNYYNKKYTVDFIEKEKELFFEYYPKVVDKIKQAYLNTYYPDSEYSIEDLEIKEFYVSSYTKMYIVKIINNKDLKEEDLYTTNIGGYEIIDDKNNPIFYFLNYHDVSVCKFLKLEEAYYAGFLPRRVLHMVELTQKNIYYKNN